MIVDTNPSPNQFGLIANDPRHGMPAFCGVEAVARLDGLMFELTWRQVFRNSGVKPLEVIYTFPLPAQAVLLSFASQLNGVRQEGRIVAKSDAERTYEEALDEGDAPVMLEANDGIYTANIGNLNPGDEIVMEVRSVQLVAPEQGRLRVAIPTTIAPRYGNAARAGLQAHQVPTASLTAEYSLKLQLEVGSSYADAEIACPTHRCRHEKTAGGFRLVLANDARLDRDVVFTVQPRQATPVLLLKGADLMASHAPTVLMAAFTPKQFGRRQRTALKLLVDCSGSMAGDSIASARRALHAVVEQLGDGDEVSLTRFGSDTEQVLAPAPASAYHRRRISQALGATDATLGGTEMVKALQQAFALPVNLDIGSGTVLLVTDGEIWEVDSLVQQARTSGHRVFIIGVGSSPAERVLRKLAEATGGACEFATPGESLEAAATKMMARICQVGLQNARIDWGCEPEWQTDLPSCIFGGDTVWAFAGLAAGALPEAVQLISEAQADGQVASAPFSTAAMMDGDSLARLAAAIRLIGLATPVAKQLAVDYQLVSEHTNCILVHLREAAGKTTDEAELHRVESMLAAGWGGTASVSAAGGVSSIDMVHAAGAMLSPRGAPLSTDFVEACQVSVDKWSPIDRIRLAFQIANFVAANSGPIGLELQISLDDADAELWKAFDALVGLGIGRGDAYMVFAHWMALQDPYAFSEAQRLVLERAVSALTESALSPALCELDRLLSGGSTSAVNDARHRRLERAIALTRQE